MKRRKFLQSGSLLTLPYLLNGLNTTAIARSSLSKLIEEDNDKVLILVQLNGGNDGLSSLIPLSEYDNLVKARPNLIIPENEVLKINNEVGFHPSLVGFDNLYKDGKLGMIQSVGYPDQNRSHFRSTDIWTSGSDSDEFITSGWLGRWFDTQYPGFPDGYPNEDNPDPFAISMGYIVSETCQGASTNFSFAVSDVENLIQLDETVGGEYADTCYGQEMKFVQDIIRQSNAYSETVLAAYEKGKTNYDYPDTSLAKQLATVASLINGGLKTKVYVVSQGGYDTHANQVDENDILQGDHANLLKVLGDAIEAFQNDLVSQGNDKRVVGMTFSEFGRRIKSNDSFGTDHGTAAPVFVFGSCIASEIIGDNPEIKTDVDIKDGVEMQYDFRSVYASLMMDWFDIDEEKIREILFDNFDYIPIIEGCSNITSVPEKHIPINNDIIYPNPSHGRSILEVTSSGEEIIIDLIDVRGSKVRNLKNQYLHIGQHEIPLDLSNLNEGIYFVKINQGNSQRSIKVVLK